jgi:hypothetical protein
MSLRFYCFGCLVTYVLVESSYMHYVNGVQKVFSLLVPKNRLNCGSAGVNFAFCCCCENGLSETWHYVVRVDFIGHEWVRRSRDASGWLVTVEYSASCGS